MTFLPIVGRELRVASRRKFSWASRLVAAAFALLLFLALQLSYRSSAGPGAIEFDVIKWTAFVLALFAGAFLTADSLSEERRQGTLGLLFLTDLRGYDVVLGKLVSHSLLGFYGLLAVFPVLGLAFMAGGVTFTEFWQVLLVICNTLFFSLTLGLLASSLSQDSAKTLLAALCLNVLFSAGLVAADWLLGLAVGGGFSAGLSFASPGYLFAVIGGVRFPEFWPCLAVQHALAWVFLFAAARRTPRIWQEKAEAAVSSTGFFQRWRFGSRNARLAFRRKYLDRDPIAWIVLRDRWLPRVIWMFTFIMIVPRIALLLGSYIFGSSLGGSYVSIIILSYSQTLLAFFQQLFIAMLACRFLATSRSAGALELLLVTPISARQMVRGQLAAMWKALAFPLITISAVYLFYVAVSLVPRAGSSSQYSAFYGVVMIVPSLVQPFTDAAGLTLFGMWMGLTNRKSSAAISKTMIYGWLLPLFALWFIQLLFQYLMVSRSGAGLRAVLMLNTASIILYLGKDAFFIFWSWNRLTTRFRAAAAEVAIPASGWWKKLLPVISPLRHGGNFSDAGPGGSA